MYKLFSERIKNKNGEPEVYSYDVSSKAFRNQVFYIMADVLDIYEEHGDSLWDYMHDSFAREMGLKKLGRYGEGYKKNNIEEFVDESFNDAFLDLVDYIFHLFDVGCRDIQPRYRSDLDTNMLVNKAVEELNYRFKQHNLGYEFVNGEIIRIDNKVIHQEVIKPALRLLYEEGFEGAEEEFRKAFEYRRKGDNKNAILEAGKSFESVMKTICDKKEYKYDKAKDTAKALINILEHNNFYPSYMSAHMASLRTTLETGLPVVRNKKAGHGQGSTVEFISDEFAEYALNLAAANIVLLVGIYKNEKEK
ncbi:MAG: hypothetical protein HFI03_15265 [Lachnospiraceae bacterium]|uniref:STM4504/CBY_0614 family protein n=1 Tax=Romboutsia ilealis TaxID=1115758 RepID=UPI0026F39B2C|nr:hypothetical protein [Romboutsia ilealis]MCI9201710.1 hypothetical protein [Lachnospiraceae bacterium]